MQFISYVGVFIFVPADVKVLDAFDGANVLKLLLLSKIVKFLKI